MVNTLRCTTLGNESIEIATVEHFLAACAGLYIDNLLVELEGLEIPIMDGSSLAFATELKEAGIKKQEKEKEVLQIDKKLSLRIKDSFVVAMPADEFSLTVVVDYNNPAIGFQMAQFDMEKDNFIEKLAPARTFGFKKEIEFLRHQNLALGGSLENALVIDENEYINEPRFNNEVAMHKLLDLLGDLSLCGKDLRGHFFACRGSHALHIAFIKMMLDKTRELISPQGGK